MELGDRMRRILALAAMCGCIGAAAAMLRERNPWHLAAAVPWVALACLVHTKSSVTAARLRGERTKPGSKTGTLAEVYRATTEALASAIAAKDTYEQHHVGRVQALCVLVGEKMGLDQDQMDAMRIAAMVHDVGKLGVPDHILLKPGPLDPDEFAKISNHATVGARILSNVDYPWNISEIVRHHHEHYDGTGYPDRIAGEQIPLASRIIAVAEVYDALVSDRCYRSGWPHRQAIEHMEMLSGSHFDPQVVSALLEVEAQVAELEQQTASDQRTAPGTPAGECCAAADVIAQANRELVSLFEIADTLSSTLELDEVLALLAHRTRRLLNAATCVVFVPDEDGSGRLTARAASGRWQELMKGSTVRMGKGVTGKAAAKLRPYSGSYDPNDITFGIRGDLAVGLKSCLVAPIMNFGELLATINVYDACANAFSADDLRTLVSVASRAALAIQNASAFETVRDSALKDPVTGLYNGRYLRTYLEHEISRAARHHEPITVLGIDLDNFKAVNDRFGHFRGDTVLKDAADIFRMQLRDYDVVVRNGGDEFVVVLSGASPEEAEHTAERIRGEFAQYARRTLGSALVPLGVSVGVASYPDDATDAETLLALADAAMYREKRAHKEERSAA